MELRAHASRAYLNELLEHRSASRVFESDREPRAPNSR